MGVTWQLIDGDCVERMRELPAESIDAVVTDPPYGLEFMGADWDRLRPSDAARANGARKHGTDRVGAYERAGVRYVVDAAEMQEWHRSWAEAARRVLKPGGYLVSFGGTRTYHRMTCGIEDAGFDIRDQLAWLFGSGFPKSLNVERALMQLETEQLTFEELDASEWAGWGTALKPGHEPVVLARKPLVGTVAENVRAFGTGGLNIDAGRVSWCDVADEREAKDKNRHADFGSGPRGNKVFGADKRDRGQDGNYDAPGRWPANVAVDGAAGALLDGQGGDVARFYYCAKTSRAERELGLATERFGRRDLNWSSGTQNPGSFQSEGTSRDVLNYHPTVKPIDLMRWLCRLITPPGGALLDPFTGSGSTGCAAVLEGFDFIGTERDAEYVAIAEARIDHWSKVAEMQEAA